MSVIARVVNLQKTYQMGTELVHALRGVSIDFEAGDFVALMGPSGSGKSTLLNLLGCLDRPSVGHYYLAGQDVSQMDDDQLSDIRSKYLGFIFQAYNLIAQYTVVENIEVPLLYQGKVNTQTRARCIRLAEMVGLGQRLDHRPPQLSGGQQQRVAIARSLAMKPKLMLFDEVTSALDPELTGEVLKVIENLAVDGMTMVLVTHEMHFARNVADQILFMHDGVVWERGNGDMLTQPKTAELTQFVGSGF